MPGKSPAPKSVTFRTTVHQTGKNTGIVVPPEAIAELDAGSRPPVLVEVTLTVADAPRPVEVPPDLAAAFRANKPAGAFFETLSNSVQRFHIDQINGAKTDETRQRRIDKAVATLLEGKKR